MRKKKSRENTVRLLCFIALSVPCSVFRAREFPAKSGWEMGHFLLTAPCMFALMHLVLNEIFILE